MIASRVHAVVAAGLDSPGLLASWRREPEVLRRYGVEPGTLDLDALWKFAGLAAKVRHNGLRGDLPLTFRLLSVAALEIDLFASYASGRGSGPVRFAEGAEARAQELVAFLERWLDRGRREHALLWDVVRHEVALMRLGKEVAAAPEGPAGDPGAPARASSVPRVRGRILLEVMRSDPGAVAAALQEQVPRLDAVPLGTHHLCYWREGSSCAVDVLELDELGFYLLASADGKRSAADLSRQLGGSRRPPRAILRALQQLAAVGVLALQARSRGTAP